MKGFYLGMFRINFEQVKHHLPEAMLDAFLAAFKAKLVEWEFLEAEGV